MPKPNLHLSLITGAYYYIALTVLVFLLVLIGYWQVQKDRTEIHLAEFSVLSIEGNRGFRIPVSFCNRDITEFQVERYYFNTQERIYYTVPSTTYLAPQEDLDDGCFNTQLTAFTGALEPGHYEYRVFLSYDINPIQSRRSLAALVYVEVQ